MSDYSQHERLKELGLHSGDAWPSEQRVLKNVYWYTQRPLLAGIGDIRTGAPQRISRNLDHTEFFALLQRHNVPNPDSDERPSLEHLAANFGMLIVSKCVYLPNHPEERVDMPVRIETDHPAITTARALDKLEEISVHVR